MPTGLSPCLCSLQNVWRIEDVVVFGARLATRVARKAVRPLLVGEYDCLKQAVVYTHAIRNP
jgi:hypothetical protein